MKSLLWIVITLFLAACGSTDNPTDSSESGVTKEEILSETSKTTESSKATVKEMVTVAGELSNFDGETSEVNVFFENEDGDVVEAELDEAYTFSKELEKGKSYFCYVQISGESSDTLPLGELSASVDYSGLMIIQV